MDPASVHIPPPQPPTDRLLKAVDEFYLEETEDAPRNRLASYCIGCGIHVYCQELMSVAKAMQARLISS